jgi:hypothetical protein
VPHVCPIASPLMCCQRLHALCSCWYRFPVDVVRFLCQQISLAIGYLHSKGLTFFNLQPDNIFINADGHACLLHPLLALPSDKILSESRVVEYAVPEKVESPAADWWRLGVMLYELSVGMPPFRSREKGPARDEDITKQINEFTLEKLRFPPFVTGELKEMIKGFLTPDPAQRLGGRGADIQEIKDHGFFAGADDMVSWDDLTAAKGSAPEKTPSWIREKVTQATKYGGRLRHMRNYPVTYSRTLTLEVLAARNLPAPLRPTFCNLICEHRSQATKPIPSDTGAPDWGGEKFKWDVQADPEQGGAGEVVLEVFQEPKKSSEEAAVIGQVTIGVADISNAYPGNLDLWQSLFDPQSGMPKGEVHVIYQWDQQRVDMLPPNYIAPDLSGVEFFEHFGQATRKKAKVVATEAPVAVAVEETKSDTPTLSAPPNAHQRTDSTASASPDNGTPATNLTSPIAKQVEDSDDEEHAAASDSDDDGKARKNRSASTASGPGRKSVNGRGHTNGTSAADAEEKARRAAEAAEEAAAAEAEAARVAAEAAALESARQAADAEEEAARKLADEQQRAAEDAEKAAELAREAAAAETAAEETAALAAIEAEKERVAAETAAREEAARQAEEAEKLRVAEEKRKKEAEEKERKRREIAERERAQLAAEAAAEEARRRKEEEEEERRRKEEEDDEAARMAELQRIRDDARKALEAERAKLAEERKKLEDDRRRYEDDRRRKLMEVERAKLEAERRAIEEERARYERERVEQEAETERLQQEMARLESEKTAAKLATEKEAAERARLAAASAAAKLAEERAAAERQRIAAEKAAKEAETRRIEEERKLAERQAAEAAAEAERQAREAEEEAAAVAKEAAAAAAKEAAATAAAERERQERAAASAAKKAATDKAAAERKAATEKAAAEKAALMAAAEAKAAQEAKELEAKAAAEKAAAEKELAAKV